MCGREVNRDIAITILLLRRKEAVKDVLYLYARGGFIVRLCLMDREFEPVKDLVPIVEINTTAAREHVGLIERRIRLVKEKQEPLAACFRLKIYQ